ncbi:MAG: HupE/UreJ family protein, partial [Rhizobiales bacterium]|nr:HupE/UreJ family protein [Hyphomicrobiales bacterium]
MQRPSREGPPRNMCGRSALFMLAVLFGQVMLASSAFAHAVAEGDKGYIQEITGVHLIPFIYLGAKHMVTGYDHVL